MHTQPATGSVQSAAVEVAVLHNFYNRYCFRQRPCTTLHATGVRVTAQTQQLHQQWQHQQQAADGKQKLERQQQQHQGFRHETRCVTAGFNGPAGGMRVILREGEEEGVLARVGTFRTVGLRSMELPRTCDETWRVGERHAARGVIQLELFSLTGGVAALVMLYLAAPTELLRCCGSCLTGKATTAAACCCRAKFVPPHNGNAVLAIWFLQRYGVMHGRRGACRFWGGKRPPLR